MARYRTALPQLGDSLFLTDGGIETTLIYREGFDLPDFASFVLLESAPGEAALRRYFRSYAELARCYGTGLVLESATWRASADWGARLGYSPAALTAANRRAVDLLSEVRDRYDSRATPVVISGCVGPRGDGYRPDAQMSAQEAQNYHADQVWTFAATEVDMVSALTMTHVEEAIGIARAAEKAGMPVAISFTVETDGRLPTGDSLQAAIEATDRATDGYPAYYMLNCAHPSHFGKALAPGAAWTARLRGLRANASRRRHAELDAATTLDIGDPLALAQDYAQLRRKLGGLNVLGGCCGTDERHIEQIAAVCQPLFRATA